LVPEERSYFLFSSRSVDMSGALVSLVSKGQQDAYLINNDNGASFFQSKYSRHTNFSQAPKLLNIFGGAVAPSSMSVIDLANNGDLINGLWLHGGDGDQVVIPDVHAPPGLVGCLFGTVFELWIGGQMVDSQPFDYMTDVWSVYLAENATKKSMMTNFMTTDNTNLDYTFVPLHFFFCDNDMFLPLLAIQYHAVELRIKWGPYVDQIQSGPVKCYGNFIYLDEKEREKMTRTPMDLVVTQVQRSVPMLDASKSSGQIDLSVLNHPVKAIFFGYPSLGWSSTWNFASADMLLNGQYLFENMYPAYFHSVQAYYHTKNSNAQFSSDPSFKTPVYTQYYMYSFGLDATSYKPTGACNFSRLDSAAINIIQPEVYTVAGYQPLGPFTVYAVCYNVLRIKQGLAGILFGN
jgi:hypothetical protein